MFIVYMLYSRSLKKFYTGFTADPEQRMLFHNGGLEHIHEKAFLVENQ